jgi:hypothetical protein
MFIRRDPQNFRIEPIAGRIKSKISVSFAHKFNYMILKIFKGVWFFSLLALFVVFFYVYAGLPEEVVLSASEESLSISRNGFFYATIMLFAMLNVLVFVVTKLLSNGDQVFSSWFYGLIITFNFFFLASLGFIHVFNGGDRYDYSRMGPAMYGSLILLCVWMISWPIYLGYKKILAK